MQCKNIHQVHIIAIDDTFFTLCHEPHCMEIIEYIYIYYINYKIIVQFRPALITCFLLCRPCLPKACRPLHSNFKCICLHLEIVGIVPECFAKHHLRRHPVRRADERVVLLQRRLVLRRHAEVSCGRKDDQYSSAKSKL